MLTPDTTKGEAADLSLLWPEMAETIKAARLHHVGLAREQEKLILADEQRQRELVVEKEMVALLGPRYELELKRTKGPSTAKALSNYRADIARFKAWCEHRLVGWLPATPFSVANFVVSEASAGTSVDRLKQMCSAIAVVHRLSKLPDPTPDPIVRAARRWSRDVQPLLQEKAAQAREEAKS